MSNELYARLLEAQWQRPMTIVPPPTWHQLAKQLLRIPPKPVVAISKSELKNLIIEQIQTYGTACDLNHIDVSNLHDMTGVFSTLPFNGDVSKWNVSRVISMESMFAHCPFDGDISQWDVANVTTMRGMFEGSYFAQDISQWNTSQVSDMSRMFKSSHFDGDLSGWNVSRVISMESMFADSAFKGNIASWVIRDGCDIDQMAPKHYGNNPLFLAQAYRDQARLPELEPYYSRAVSILDSLGVQGLHAGYSLYQMIQSMREGKELPAHECGLTDFS